MDGWDDDDICGGRVHGVWYGVCVYGWLISPVSHLPLSVSLIWSGWQFSCPLLACCCPSACLVCLVCLSVCSLYSCVPYFHTEPHCLPLTRPLLSLCDACLTCLSVCLSVDASSMQCFAFWYTCLSKIRTRPPCITRHRLSHRPVSMCARARRGGWLRHMECTLTHTHTSISIHRR